MSNNRDDDKGDYKRSRIAEMMKHRFLGGGPVEPPVVDVDYSAADQRIIMLHGEKARGVSTYEMGRGSEQGDKAHELMEVGWMAYQTMMDYGRVGEYGLTWVGWLEKYSQYVKGEGEREGEGTPIFQQTIVEELTMAHTHIRAQRAWFGDDFDAGEGGI